MFQCIKDGQVMPWFSFSFLHSSNEHVIKQSYSTMSCTPIYTFLKNAVYNAYASLAEASEIVQVVTSAT